MQAFQESAANWIAGPWRDKFVDAFANHSSFSVNTVNLWKAFGMQQSTILLVSVESSW